MKSVSIEKGEKNLVDKFLCVSFVFAVVVRFAGFLDQGLEIFDCDGRLCFDFEGLLLQRFHCQLHSNRDGLRTFYKIKIYVTKKRSERKKRNGPYLKVSNEVKILTKL